MALITTGSVVTDIRNSIGGVTYSRNKGGAYARARVAPINPNTPAQSLVRANFAANAKAWATLTPAQQQTWTNFAAANPLVNVLGASIIVSGIAYFMRLNQVLAQIGIAFMLSPPSSPTFGLNPDATGVAAVVATPSVIITYGGTTSVSTSDYYIFATPPLSPGRTPGTSDYRFLTFGKPASMASTMDVTTAYNNLFGNFISGQNIGFAVSQVDTLSGLVTPALIFQIIAS